MANMSFLDMLLGRDYNRQAAESEYLAALDEWANELIKLYYGPLIEEKEALGFIGEQIIQEYIKLFTVELNAGPLQSEQTKISHLLEELRSTRAGLSPQNYIAALRYLFLDSFNKPEQVANNTKQNNAMIMRMNAVGTDISVRITLALQAILRSELVDWRFRYGKISTRLEAKMAAILRDIDNNLCQPMALEHTDLQLSALLADLVHRIGQVNGNIRLPLISLVNAPLSGENLVDLYARESEARESRLARQILRGNGVILITGYRGVGKSTFVNKVLHELENKYAALQTSRPTWRVVPVRISLAKTTSVSSVLRHCVRALHDIFLGKNGLAHLLYPQEKEDLHTAYQRVTYHFRFEQTELARNEARTQVALNANLGHYTGGLFIPAFKGRLRRNWQKKTEQSLRFHDYDEEQAERDVAKFIDSLACERSPAFLMEQQRPVSKLKQVLKSKQNSNQTDYRDNIRIKLVFVFDEMDKMDVEEGQMPLIQQLKNLFLNQHAVFLLLTSKTFYYRWLMDRRQEDSILNSYFSSVMMVPLFSTEDTLRLLRNISMIAWAKQTPPVVEDFARYLNYRAMGIPREILRELYEWQRWLPDSLQPFLTDETNEFGIVRLYAAMQAALEETPVRSAKPGGLAASVMSADQANQASLVETGLSTPEDNTTPIEESVGQQSDNNPGQTTANNGASSEAAIAPERFWLHEGFIEQARRGQYILVEQLLFDGEISWSPQFLDEKKDGKDNELQQLYTKNFGLVSRKDFLILLDDMAERLDKIRIKKGDFPQLFSPDSASETFPLFVAEKISRGGLEIQRLVVLEEFYSITGRSPRKQALLLAQEADGASLTPEQIKEMLKSGSLAEKLDALRQAQNSEVDLATLQKELYDIFVNRGVLLTSRLSAGSRLDGVQFLRLAATKGYNQVLQSESNNEILQQVVDLISRAQPRFNNELREIQRELLLILIKRSATTSDRVKSTSQKLPESLFVKCVQLLVNAGPEQGDLIVVVQGLEPNQELSTATLSLLLELQDVSQISLIDLLIKQRIKKMPSGMVRDALQKEEGNLPKLWTTLTTPREYAVLSARYAPLSEQILPEILLKFAQNSQENNVFPLKDNRLIPIIEWLNSNQWFSEDQKILEQATANNPDVLVYLEHLVGRDNKKLQAIRSAKSAPTASPRTPSAPPPQPTSKVTPTQKSSKNKPRWWALGLIALLIWGGIFIALPFDLPDNVTFTGRISGRSLQCLAPFLFFVGMISISIWSDKKDTIGLLLLGILSFIVTGITFYVVGVWLAHPLTWVGQIVLMLVSAAGWIGLGSLILES